MHELRPKKNIKSHYHIVQYEDNTVALKPKIDLRVANEVCGMNYIAKQVGSSIHFPDGTTLGAGRYLRFNRNSFIIIRAYINADMIYFEGIYAKRDHRFL